MPPPSLRHELSPRVEQSLALQPRLLASVEVLQLGALDLREFLTEKALTNEALELEAMEGGLTEWSASSGSESRRGADASDAYARMLQEQPAQTPGLQPFLNEQLLTLDLSEGECAWLGFLIECLDDGGTLSMPDEFLLEGALALGLKGGMSALGRAIGILQSLEPRGVGGRNAVEAMLLQLDPTSSDYAHLCQLLENCLHDLAANKWPKVARRLGITTDDVARLVARLAELDPRPAAELSGQAAPVLAPDLTLSAASDGSFQLSLEKGLWPEVHIDAHVAQLAKDPSLSREVREHLRGKLDEARWLVEAVEQRQVTLLRVANAVLQAQPEFLAEGRRALLPLGMQTIAERLGMAVSTVSRAVAGKCIDTPHGILPLREFFQSQAGTTSQEGLRDRLRALVQAEDPRAPLSDDRLMEALAAQGLRVARRTVAKYRRELGIKSSYQRTQHA